jgi:hypothetical protein
MKTNKTKKDREAWALPIASICFSEGDVEPLDGLEQRTTGSNLHFFKGFPPAIAVRIGCEQVSRWTQLGA